MKFVPYTELGNRPNIIVDGARHEATVLTLSHWPKSGTPAPLKRDTSAAIAFAYLDAPGFHVDVDVISNDHFDEDGLIGLFTLLNPAFAERHRALLIDAASAGDFGTYADTRAARIAFTIAAFADRTRSPLDAAIFGLGYDERVAALYSALLDRLEDIVRDTDAYRDYWEAPEALLHATTRALADGAITIREQPELDLAIVHVPSPGKEVTDFDAICHPYAIYSNTRRNRILLVCERQYEFRFRYESWVQMVTHRPLPRVDLGPLVDVLNEAEQSGGQWQADGVEEITPRMYLVDAAASSLSEQDFTERLVHALRTGEPAWDPFD